MEFEAPHISDEELLLAIDAELPHGEAAEVAAHLEQCWSCRARRREIESAIAVFMQVHQRNLNPELPPSAGPRALLRARMARMPAPRTFPKPFRLYGRRSPPCWWSRRWLRCWPAAGRR